jgi:hypothetical protein
MPIDSVTVRFAGQTVTVGTSEQWYWCPHDRFRYDYDGRETGGWRYNPAGTGRARASARDSNNSQPEVYRLDPQHSTRLDEPWQNLLCGINPELERDKTLTLLGEGLAFCNGTFGVLDQPRLMGGAVVRGRVDGNKLWIKTLLTSQPIPSPAQVLADRLWFWCVGVQPDGDVNLWWRRGIDGHMYTPKMLIVSAQPIFVALDEVLLLPPGFIPGPQWMP